MKLNLPPSSYLAAAIAILPVAPPPASADAAADAAATSDKSSDPASHYRNLRSGGVVAVDGTDRELALADAGDTTMADPASVKCAEDNFTEEIMYDNTGGKVPN